MGPLATLKENLVHPRTSRFGLRAVVGAGVAALALLLVGGPAAQAAPVATHTVQAPALGAPTALSADVKGKTFTIGTDTAFAPFDYTDDAGDVKGIDISLIKAIATAEGFTVDIKPMGFQPAVTALDAGQVDGVIAGMSITDERKKSFDFSDPYFTSGIAMAVNSTNTEINSYEDMRGKKAIAKNGSEGLSVGEELSKKYGFTISSIEQSQALYEAVKSGQYDAVFDDTPVLQYAEAQGRGLRVVGDPKPAGDYGFAVKKGQNQELLTAFNAGLAKIKDSGEYQQILDSFLKSPETSSSSKGNIFQLAEQSWPALSKGLVNTLKVTGAAFVLALVLGLIFGLMKITQSRWLRGIATVYVAIFRGTPLLVWAFFFYFGLPQLTGVRVDAFLAGMLALGLNAGAYLTEIIRGAIQSVDPGQMEASRSLGLGWGKSMQRVVIPQAAKIATPSIINQLVIMIKDSSLLLAIGFGELLYQAQQLYAANFRVTETLLIVGVMYFVAITILTWLANIVDRKVNR